ADGLPALAGVGRPVQELAGGVDGVVIVRRDVDDVRPVPAETRVLCRRIEELLRPDVHGPRQTRAHVVDFDAAAIAGTPDDVRVGRVGDGEARLAAGGAAPGDGAAEAGGRAAHRRLVLLVAVQAVGDGVVHRDVVHLRDRQHDPAPGAAVVGGDHDAAVVAD